MARAAKKTTGKTTGKATGKTTAESARAAAKPGARSLAAAVTHAPRLTDRDAAQARLAEWLAEIGKSAAGKALKRLIDGSSKLEALLLGLADGSPYLWELATAEPERLLEVLEADPDSRLSALLAKSAKAAASAKGEAAAMRL